MTQTLARVESRADAKLLQLTCVYGKLTPALLSHTGNEVYLCDAATGQLQLARRKTRLVADRCHLSRMYAESLGYRDDVFDQVIVFFLFHEMPAAARLSTYSEIARVVRTGGSVLITEYAETPRHHWLYRFIPFRRLLGRLEPFLPEFWSENVSELLNDALRQHGKMLDGEPEVEYCFGRFYRVMRLDIVRYEQPDALARG